MGEATSRGGVTQMGGATPRGGATQMGEATPRGGVTQIFAAPKFLKNLKIQMYQKEN